MSRAVLRPEGRRGEEREGWREREEGKGEGGEKGEEGREEKGDEVGKMGKQSAN